MTTHPVALLRERLVAEFSAELPHGVSPVTEFCCEPQFFPGATGLLRAETWSEVVPGIDAPVSNGGYPEADVRVMAIGNYQATQASYQRILRGEIGGFAQTWRGLRMLLEGVPPAQVFLTNAYVGLPDLARDTAPFPSTREFDERCSGLLALAVEVFGPQCVVCLGTAAARAFARMAAGLDAWRPWPGYAALSASGGNVVTTACLGERQFTAVAVRHPSSRISDAERRAERDLIGRAVGSSPASDTHA